MKSLMFSLLLMITACGSKDEPAFPTPETASTPTFIAHATGHYNGRSYLNCPECLLQNYDKGFRYFEIDFMLTVDGRLAGLHNGMEPVFNIPNDTFTYDQFASSQPEGFSPLTEERLVELFQQKDDWYLASDVKTSDNVKSIERLCTFMAENNLSCADRVVPYFFSQDDYHALKKYQFKKSIWGLYRFRNDIKAVEEFLKENPLYAIAFPSDWWSPEWKALMVKYGVKAFIHTINSKEESDKLFDSGADGIITDTLFY